jgi:uncharacterized protein (DUF433 family)
MTDIDWSHCTIVERDPEKMGGVPTVRGWRLSADSVVENYDYGVSAKQIASMFHVPLEDILAILAYAMKERSREHARAV